jgi:hypothetical protein
MLEIDGAGFGASGSVKIGGTTIAANEITWTSNQIKCLTPPGSGTESVQVVPSSGDVLTGLSFTYDPAPASVPALPAGTDAMLALFLGLAGTGALRSRARSRTLTS